MRMRDFFRPILPDEGGINPLSVLELVWPPEDPEVARLLKNIDCVTANATRAATNEEWEAMYRARHLSSQLNDELAKALAAKHEAA